MIPEEGPSLRERNKARARAEIADAALRLFSDKGFAGVTVDEIVAAAGVSRRTFFRYFDTKEDALLADYPELTGWLTDSLLERGQENLFEAIRAGLHRVAGWYVDRSDVVLDRSRVIRDTSQLAARNLEFLSQWERTIASAVAARIGRDAGDLLPRTAGAAVVGAFRAALAQWVRSSCVVDLHTLVDRSLDLVGRGLFAELGEAHANRG